MSDEEKDETKELYPILAEKVTRYEIKPFAPIDRHDTEDATSDSDLGVVNNFLAVCDASLLSVRTIENLCSLSNAVCKLIETRRKIKKLPFGQEPGGRGRVFEIVE